jgi:predicted RNA methylase
MANQSKQEIDQSISNFLMVNECLLDARRVAFFKHAIERMIKPHHVVVDAGTGTGIIALIAAKYGAKKVYAVERDPLIARIASHNVVTNKMDHKIEVINADIREFKLPRGTHADMVTMEMLDTGLVAEQQAEGILGLRKNGVITNDSILLPDRIGCTVRAIEYDFDFYGFSIPIVVQARNYGATHRIKKRLSLAHLYAEIDLKSIKSTQVDTRVEVVIKEDGLINAIELESTIWLGGKKYGDTSDMNMPVVIPVKRRKVRAGEKINFKIEYLMGQGFGNFHIT